ERVAEPVSIEMHEGLDRLAADGQVGQNHLVDAVIVPRVPRRHLVAPLRLPRVDVAREDRNRPLVVAGALARVPGRRIPGAVVYEVQRRIERIPAPRRAPARRPLIALPRRDPLVLLTEMWVGFVEVIVEQNLFVGAHAVGAPDALAGLDVIGLTCPRTPNSPPLTPTMTLSFITCGAP